LRTGEEGATEDEKVGWHHRRNGHEFEQTLGDGQGSLAYCSPWSHKESDTTEQLKSNNNQHIMLKQRVLPVLLRTTQGQFVHLGCGATQPLAITYDVPVHCSLKTASITPRLITPKSSPTSTQCLCVSCVSVLPLCVFVSQSVCHSQFVCLCLCLSVCVSLSVFVSLYVVCSLFFSVCVSRSQECVSLSG